MITTQQHAQLLQELAAIAHELGRCIESHGPRFEEEAKSAHAAATRARLAAEEIEGREVPSDEEILAAVRHLYGDDKAAAMGAEDDLKTARAVLARFGGGEAGS